MSFERMLPRVLSIGSIEDFEDLVASVITVFLRREGAWLDRDEKDDLLLFVLSEASIFAQERELTANGNLRSLVASRSWFLCIEWYRSRYGRRGHHRPQEGQEWKSLDEAVAGESSERPLQSLFGQAGLDDEAVFTPWDRWLLAASDLTTAELAKFGLTSKQATGYRRALKERVRSALVAM